MELKGRMVTVDEDSTSSFLNFIMAGTLEKRFRIFMLKGSVVFIVLKILIANNYKKTYICVCIMHIIYNEKALLSTKSCGRG